MVKLLENKFLEQWTKLLFKKKWDRKIDLNLFLEI